MARNTIPKGKLVRRFGENIFGNPKYDKLLKNKPNAPGKSPSDRKKKKDSDYGKSLKEKQKFKYGYGISEKQLKAIYKEANRIDGDTGLNLITLAEKRLDNILLRANFASTTAQARQLVSHGHVCINNKKMDVASYSVKMNDIVSIRNKETSKNLVKNYITLNEHLLTSDWLETDDNSLTIKILRLPEKSETRFLGQEQMIIEYYSR